jgi:hypothetical protein
MLLGHGYRKSFQHIDVNFGMKPVGRRVRIWFMPVVQPVQPEAKDY